MPLLMMCFACDISVSQDEPEYEMCAVSPPFSQRIFSLGASYNTSTEAVESLTPSCGCTITRKNQSAIIYITVQKFHCTTPCSSRLQIYKDACLLKEICCSDTFEPAGEVFHVRTPDQRELFLGFNSVNVSETVVADVAVYVSGRFPTLVDNHTKAHST